MTDRLSSNDRDHPLQGKRALICEDEGITQMQLSRVLAREGLLVVGQAIDGMQAVEIALRERPDLILMDLTMPVLDGLEAARRILAAYSACVVMLTGQEGAKEQGLAVGACGYLLKPVTRENLLPALATAFEEFTRREGAHVTDHAR